MGTANTATECVGAVQQHTDLPRLDRLNSRIGTAESRCICDRLPLGNSCNNGGGDRLLLLHSAEHRSLIDSRDDG